jgi:hypothetical protein
MPNPLVIVHHRLNKAGPNDLELFAGSLAAAVDPKLLMDPKLMVVQLTHRAVRAAFHTICLRRVA